MKSKFKFNFNTVNRNISIKPIFKLITIIAEGDQGVRVTIYSLRKLIDLR